MRATVHDIRLALRQWTTAPGFCAAAVITLGLGLGGTTAIFSLVDALLLRPLPFADADRLVRVTSEVGRSGNTDAGVAVPELDDYRRATDLFENVSALYPVNANLTGIDRPVRLEGLIVSGSYFELLGVRAAHGRVLQHADEVPGIGSVAVITDTLWRRELGADAKVLGRVVRLDGDPVEIVGVLPPDFRHPGRGIEGEPEFFLPAAFTAAPFGPPNRSFRLLRSALARLRADIPVEDAEARLMNLGAALRARHPDAYPDDTAWRPRLIPLHLDLVGPVRPAVLTLAGAVALVLMIACVNVANLLMARGSGRRREMAVRTALGASRPRLARQLLTESVVLSVAGGVAGLLVAQWYLAAAAALMPADLPLTAARTIDVRVFAFAMTLTFLSGALAGSWPALALSRGAAATGAVRAVTSTPGQARLRRGLVVAEVAMALTLLVTAGLLIRSFITAWQVDPGFTADRVLAARIWMPLPNDRTSGPYLQHDARVRFYRELLDRLAATPGVERAGFISRLPLAGGARPGGQEFLIEGESVAAAERHVAEPALASPTYFDTMGARLVRGRYFTDRDTTDQPRVLIVSESFARRYFPAGDAIGRRIRPGGRDSTAAWHEIVGIVADIHSGSLDRTPEAQIYRCVWQTSNLAMALVVRAAGDPAALEAQVRAAVRAIDPDLPLFGVRPMRDLLAASLAPRRFAIAAVGTFAALALVLAAVGLYGVLAYSVQQRRGEIGVHMALGATPRRIARLIVGEGMTMAMAGIGLGLAGAFAAARAISGMLFGVSTVDPWSFGGLAAVLASVALIASWLPARRAARVDPVVSLRAL